MSHGFLKSVRLQYPGSHIAARGGLLEEGEATEQAFGPGKLLRLASEPIVDAGSTVKIEASMQASLSQALVLPWRAFWPR